MKRLSHLNEAGEAAMVDVSSKPALLREATASGEIELRAETLLLIQQNRVAKGNVLAVARVAGIMAAKKTGELIPLCHPLAVSHAEVEFEFPPEGGRIRITATARVTAATGVEMEALTAVCVAALTIYDMCKAVDDSMRIESVRLVRKTKRKASPGTP